MVRVWYVHEWSIRVLLLSMICFKNNGETLTEQDKHKILYWYGVQHVLLILLSMNSCYTDEIMPFQLLDCQIILLRILIK